MKVFLLSTKRNSVKSELYWRSSLSFYFSKSGLESFIISVLPETYFDSVNDLLKLFSAYYFNRASSCLISIYSFSFPLPRNLFNLENIFMEYFYVYNLLFLYKLFIFKQRKCYQIFYSGSKSKNSIYSLLILLYWV